MRRQSRRTGDRSGAGQQVRGGGGGGGGHPERPPGAPPPPKQPPHINEKNAATVALNKQGNGARARAARGRVSEGQVVSGEVRGGLEERGEWRREGAALQKASDAGAGLSSRTETDSARLMSASRVGGLRRGRVPKCPDR